MTKVVLDAEAFKALSSDTRLQILKALDVRRLTVSEMGRLLGLNKATVFEHLKQLAVADLVKKEEDEGRKWVYYRLTWKGRTVVHPENAQFMLMLATSVLSMGGIVAALGQVLSRWGGSSTAADPGDPDQVDSAAGVEMSPQTASDTGASGAGPTSASSPYASAPRDEAAAGTPVVAPEPAMEAPSEPAWWQDPNLWIVGLLVLLVLLAGLLAWQLARERRRERAPLKGRIESLPADVNQSEDAPGATAN